VSLIVKEQTYLI